jgi:hypothetical protein
MAKHKFDGDWTFYRVDDRNFPPNQPAHQDGTLHLVITDHSGSGSLERGSERRRPHQQPNDMDGDVTPDHITMTEHHRDGFLIFYQGDLLKPTNANQMVMVGTFLVDDAPLRERGFRRFLTDGQNDGTWVMTKP